MLPHAPVRLGHRRLLFACRRPLAVTSSLRARPTLGERSDMRMRMLWCLRGGSFTRDFPNQFPPLQCEFSTEVEATSHELPAWKYRKIKPRRMAHHFTYSSLHSLHSIQKTLPAASSFSRFLRDTAEQQPACKSGVDKYSYPS